MKIRPVRAELFHADGQTDKRDEANNRFHNITNASNKMQHKIFVEHKTPLILSLSFHFSQFLSKNTP